MSTKTETEYQRRRRESQEARDAQPHAGPGRPRVFLDAEVRKARTAERNRRNMEGRRRANLILQDRHREEYDALLASEIAGVNSERGALPGDPA